MVEKSSKIIIPLGFAAVLLLLDRFGMMGWLRTATDTVSIPIRTSIVSVRHAIFDRTAFVDSPDLTAQYTAIKVQYAQLQRENIALRQQLEAPMPSTVDYIPSRIVGFTPTTITLNVGTNDGIVKGLAVVFENHFIGYIQTVYPKSSVVNLVDHPDSAIAAQAVEHQARGIVRAIGGKLLLDKILQEETIAVGDTVVTSGMEAVPPDLVIGKVAGVEEKTQDLHKQAVLKPIINVQTLITVFVVKNK